MIIKLTGANFSQNNIGKIEFAPTLNTETLNILSNYSRELSEEQQFAFQDYLLGLKNNNLWSSIKNLYLPLLAGKVGESFFNVKTNIIDCTPNSSDYTITSNNGLKCTTEIGNSPSSIVTFPYTGSQNNLHCLFYNTSILAENQDIIDGFADNNAKWITLTTGGLNGSGRVGFVKTNNNKNVKFIGQSLLLNNSPTFQGWTQRTDGNAYINAEGVTTGTSPIDTDQTYTNLPIKPFLRFNNTMNTGGSVELGIISMGSSLTDEQMVTYKNLTDTFISSLT